MWASDGEKPLGYEIMENMEGLYRLLSLIVSLAGFTVVSGALLMRGECLFTVATRGVLTFAVLWAVQRTIGGIFKFAASSERYQDSTGSDSATQM